MPIFKGVTHHSMKLLHSIRLPEGADIDRIAVRGQYTRGGTTTELMPGYREETGVGLREAKDAVDRLG